MNEPAPWNFPLVGTEGSESYFIAVLFNPILLLSPLLEQWELASQREADDFQFDLSIGVSKRIIQSCPLLSGSIGEQRVSKLKSE